MKKPFFRRCFNRVLHFVARHGPGATSLRPFLHRLRGVQIGKGVFIADEVYLENEYPEAVEIQDGVQISVRAIIIAHTRGPGRVVIEKDAYVGPNTVIASAGGRTLRIGEGAVIGAGVVVSSDVAPQMFFSNPSAKAVARVTVPLATARRMEDFIRGLVPLKPRHDPTAVATNSGNLIESQHLSVPPV
jgi:acetyltransferase-like isoleucine patch superfamily enzyme